MKHILLISVIILSACTSFFEETRQKDLENSASSFATTTIVINNCEYLYAKEVDFGGHSGYLAHKGNCRFCAKRRQEEIKKLLFQLKQQ